MQMIRQRSVQLWYGWNALPMRTVGHVKAGRMSATDFSRMQQNVYGQHEHCPGCQCQKLVVTCSEVSVQSPLVDATILNCTHLNVQICHTDMSQF